MQSVLGPLIFGNSHIDMDTDLDIYTHEDVGMVFDMDSGLHMHSDVHTENRCIDTDP